MYRQSFNLAKKYTNPNTLGSTSIAFDIGFLLACYIPEKFTKTLTSVKLVISYSDITDSILPSNAWYKFDQSLDFGFSILESIYGQAGLVPDTSDPTVTAFNLSIDSQIVNNPSEVIGQPNTIRYVTSEIELLDVEFLQQAIAPTYKMKMEAIFNRRPELYLFGQANNFTQSGTGLALADITMLYTAQLVVSAREPSTSQIFS